MSIMYHSDDISVATLNRLPQYLNYLKTLPADYAPYISAPTIAKALNLGYVQVRKDLAFVTKSGKPKIGYDTKQLKKDLEEFLGYNDLDDVILVGAGKLGSALLESTGFAHYGLKIAYAFDVSDKCGLTLNGKPILHLDKLPEVCGNLKPRIGIICVPKQFAQAVCDLMVENGIKAIMNFAPVHLKAPADVLIQNENIAASLALLSKKL